MVRDFADILRLLRRDISPRISGWTQCHPEGPKKEGRDGRGILVNSGICNHGSEKFKQWGEGVTSQGIQAPAEAEERKQTLV